MSREIKFRAWNDGIMIIPSESFHLNEGVLDAGCWELMQFTGLQDKNGTDIYEGDIVDDQFLCGQLKLIKWDDSMACFMGDWIGGVGFNRKYESPISISTETITKGIVIGNRFENPELLEAGDK